MTRGQRKAWRVKKNVGSKVVSVKINSETSESIWLMEITANPNFKIYLEIFSDLVRVQKGYNKDIYLMFTS